MEVYSLQLKDESDEAAGASSVREEAYPQLHREHYQMQSLRYPPTLQMMYSQEELRSLAKLSRRAQEIVAFFDLVRGRATDYEEVIDLSQSLHRITSARGCIPCCLPRGILWLRQRFRLVEATEALAFQGIRRRTFAEVGGSFTPAELHALAGNAFCANTVMACTIAAFAVFPAF